MKRDRQRAFWAQWRGWFLLPTLICAALSGLILRHAGTHYWGPLDSDLRNQFYPWQVFIHRWLHRGVFPYWDPHVFGGYPTIETQQMLALNPVHLLSFLWRPEVGLALQMAAHTWIAGLGMAWALARWARLTALAAAASGVLFVLSGLFAVRVIAGHFTVVAALAWWPLAAGSVGNLMARLMPRSAAPPWRDWRGMGRRAWECRRPIALAAVFHAMVVLAGGPQYIVYLFYIEAAVVVAVAPVRWWATCALACGAVWMLALALAAPQWLPAVWYLPYTARSSTGSEMGRIDFSPLQNLWLEFIMPFPFGDGVRLGHLHFKSVWETATYPGSAAIALVLAGVFRVAFAGLKIAARGAVARRNAFTLRQMAARAGLTGPALAGLIIMGLGFYMIVGGWLPGFGGFRDATKARAVVAFGLVVFVAATLNGIILRPAHWRWPLLAGAAGQLLMLGAAGEFLDPDAFLRLIRSFGNPMDSIDALRLEATLKDPRAAISGFAHARTAAALAAAGVVVGAFCLKRWRRSAVTAIILLASGDVLVQHGYLWGATHPYAENTGLPQELDRFFRPKVAGAVAGQELPWRAVLPSAIINRPHHLEGLYEYHGYDPLMPAMAVGRHRLVGIKKIAEEQGRAWHRPLMPLTGNRYDVSLWPVEVAGGTIEVAPGEALTAPEAALFEITRHVSVRRVGRGYFGPSIGGRHFLWPTADTQTEFPPIDPDFQKSIEVSLPRYSSDGLSTRPVAQTADAVFPRPLDRPDEWNVGVKLERPALLVFKSTWLPGWRVRIDGEDMGRALFANGWMPAAMVPAGDHEVSFVYRPVAWPACVALSVAAGALISGLLIWGCGGRGCCHAADAD